MVTRRALKHVLMWSLITGMAGCSSESDRLVAVSQESTTRQAEQNQAMARLSQGIAQATRELVQADAKARQELIELQTKLQAEARSDRSNMDRRRDDLEHERQQLAQAQHRDPIVAAAIINAGLLMASLAPLLLAWLIVRGHVHEPVDAALNELLVETLFDQPLELLESGSNVTSLVREVPAAPALAASLEAQSATNKNDV